jgi:uncharacterized membrane protein
MPDSHNNGAERVPRITEVQLREPYSAPFTAPPVTPAPSLKVPIPPLVEKRNPMQKTTMGAIGGIIVTIACAGLAISGIEIPKEAVADVVYSLIAVVSAIITVIGYFGADAKKKTE